MTKVATWNVEWAEPGSQCGGQVHERLTRLGCDVVVVTEGSAGVLPEGGHVVDAGADWGYGFEPHRRKVLAWSRRPWSDVTQIDSGAGLGRVVSATTDTPLGPLLVIAVCIPWRDSRAHGTA